MNDSEIIGALECCMKAKCQNCPMYIKENQSCMGIQIFDVVALINRQEAEIKRLTQENNALNGNTEKYIEECENRSRQIAEGYRKEIKSEAVREFAEKLKKLAMAEKICVEQGRYVNVSYVNVCDIERIVKEMTEEQNV